MSLETTTKQLKAAFDKQDYRTCVKLLPLIKVELAKHQLLVPIAQKASLNPGDLVITRSILEIGALASINLSDIASFEKYIMELKPFYKLKSDFFVKNKSPSENKLVSLYLLLLLTKGEISQFHIELLALSSHATSGSVDDMSKVENDVYLNYPIKIERWLMEGSYDKVWALISTTDDTGSDAEFAFFNKSLTATLRNEIAKCLNVSYDSLPVSNAKNLLFLEDDQSLLQYVKNTPGITSTWEISHGSIYFPKKDEDLELLEPMEETWDESQFEKQPVTETVTERLIKNALGYATEMEAIV